MAFKSPSPPTIVPNSPEELLRELPRRKIPDVMPHQKEIMRKYVSDATDRSDVALQLPTGSGKTLVGLLIAEWCRRKNKERIVYLCPTRQLVNQVVEQADKKYGLTVLGFTGRINQYDLNAKTEYQSADRVAVTTYSSLFNTNPFFKDADVLIVDDAHAAENYISSFWSLRVNRTEHTELYIALRGVVTPLLEPHDLARLSDQQEDIDDREWVDKIPTHGLAKIASEVSEVLNVHTPNTALAYPWSIIRDHLTACHLYLSPQNILIRPLIPPTWSHAPFASPRQRIYMSATLGLGGDLERLMGRRRIYRLSTPDGWDRQGVGRRFFIFPGMSLDVEETAELRRKLMHQAKRSLVLVPSDQIRDEIAKDVEDNIGFDTFGAGDIEHSKEPFISANNAATVVANRYDGIDFPGEECRLLFIEGLPKTTNLQERFLMSRMGANVLFNERIQVRVLQAIGRCTRSLEDYSAVVVSGEELTDYLADYRRHKFLHPELQAEISFGVDQSKQTSFEDFVENFEIFLENGERWEEANQQIVANRNNAKQEDFPAMEELRTVVEHEVAFQEYLWQNDFESAIDSAESVLGGLYAPDLRGYRALWHYLAGSAADLGTHAGVPILKAKARKHFSEAKNAATAIPWLVSLARYQTEQPLSIEENIALMEQMERVETKLEKLGTVQDRKFAKLEKKILDGLRSEENSQFEEAHKLLGEILGFTADNVETDGSPDPWWIAGNICFVFEDHAGAQDKSVLGVNKARQVSSHPIWLRDNIKVSKETTILPVLITPVKKINKSAVAHLDNVAVWPLDKFRCWAENAIAIVREVRKTFFEPGNLEWRQMAAEKFGQNRLDASGLYAKLKSQSVADFLEEIN